MFIVSSETNALQNKQILFPIEGVTYYFFLETHLRNLKTVDYAIT